MATTNIELDIENITGIVDADDQFIISAQKFVVSSTPKDLLLFAQKASSASMDGTAISFSVNDSIADVQRNGYSCKEIPMSESIWALDSTSLKYATAKHPVFYHKQGSVHFAPVTDGSNAGYVFYVDYSKIDDDSDLRNAVVYHASASEFTKLGSAELPTVSVDAVPPDLPVLSSVIFNSNDDDVDADFPSTHPFTVATVSTTTAQLGTVKSFNDYFEDTDLNPLNDSDPGEFSMLTVPPDAPTVPNFSLDTVTGLPTYTSQGALTTLSSSTDSSKTSFTQWFDIVGDYIEDEEDVELSTAQIQKITTYIQAYSQQMADELNTFNTELQKYQAEVQKELQNSQYEQQAEHTSKIQQYQAEITNYQSEVNTEVNEYTQKLQRYSTELGIVHQSWTTMYQTAAQESIQELQVENQRNIAAAQAELQLNMDNENRSQQRQLQNSINDMQALLQNNQSKISKYQSEITVYQAESSNNIKEYQSKVQKQQAYSKEADKYYQWANAEVQIYIQNNSKMIYRTMAAQASSQQRGR